MARLILEDGKCFEGKAFGAAGKVLGEVVSHNAMNGYQQVMTDPAAAGLIVCMTYPLIGNYGVNREDAESSRFFVKGLIVSEFCEIPSNFRCEYSYDEYMRKNDIVGISDIDTRSLIRYLRDRGPLKGAIVSNGEQASSVIDELKNVIYPKGISDVTAGREYCACAGERPDVLIIDLGIRLSLLRSLEAAGVKTVLIPGNFSPDRVHELNPHAVIMAGGPGDPADVPHSVIKNTEKLIGNYPLLGISLGMQVIARALGLKTTRLKAEHRGDSYPVKDLERGRVYITSQNRGFTIDKKSLSSDITVTHLNMHDNSIEGMKHKRHPVRGIEFWPYYMEKEGAFSPDLPVFLKAQRGGNN